MNTTRLSQCVAVAAVTAALAAAGVARAAGVRIEIAAAPAELGQPIDLEVVVHNDDTEACRVLDPAFGLALSLRAPDGGALRPVQSLASLPDGLGSAADATSVEVPAGGSAALLLRATPDPLAPGAVAFRTLSGSRRRAVVDNYWRLGERGSYQLEASLRAPDVPGLRGPLCAAGASASTQITVPEPSGTLTGLAALALLGVLARRRRRAAARLVALLVFVGATGPARAALDVHPSLQGAFDACVDEFTSCPGLNTSFLGALERSDTTYRIEPSTTGSSSFNDFGFVYWAPDQTEPFSDGVPVDACAALLHELTHALEHAENQGKVDRGSCYVDGQDQGIQNTEVDATRAENDYRAACLEGGAQRTEYGGQPLPDQSCDPSPEEEPEESECQGSCGSTNGDPHLTTLDGLDYDFQAVGEFVLVESLDDDLVVQVRQRPWGGAFTRVSVNTALAARVDGTVVTLQAVGAELPRVEVEGAEVSVPDGGTILIGGVVLGRRGGTVEVAWPDGTALAADQTVRSLLNVRFSLDPARAGRVVGLLGDANGDALDDLRTREGEAIGVPPFTREVLYDQFAESWRVSDAESILPYGDGESTATFTDRSFPSERVTAADLDAADAAEALCRAAGVVVPEHLEDCILDVAATGEVAFADSAADAQVFVGDATFAVKLGDTLAKAVAPNARHRHVFDAVAGTPVDLRSTSGDVAGASWRLVGPDGSDALGPAPVADDLGTLELPATGTYRVIVDGGPLGATYALDLLAAAPAELTTIAIGDAVADTLPPGGRATYQFRVRGTRYVYPRSDTANGDGRRWRIETPSGRITVEDALANDLRRLVLAEGGFHRVVIEDPDGAGGDYAFELVSAGSDVVQDLPTLPGAAAGSVPPAGRLVVHFPGSAGTSLSFATDVADIDGQRWRLDGPDGASVISRRGLWVDLGPGTLPADGTYSLVIEAIDDSGGPFAYTTVVE